jgi:transcriptional regulator with XRE-family HTH domain
LKDWDLRIYDAAVTEVRGTATFGGNMRREREARSLTLEAVAKLLGLERAASLSTLELSQHVPKAETITKYAMAIGCEPAALLAGVVTEHDALRGSTVPTAPVVTPNAKKLPKDVQIVVDELLSRPPALRRVSAGVALAAIRALKSPRSGAHTSEQNQGGRTRPELVGRR